MQPPQVYPQGDKKRVSREKLRTIMEAASALTALGDEDDSSSTSQRSSPVEGTNTPKKESAACRDEKRFLPDHKKPDAALTFPEKLMNMMRFADKQDKNYCIAWCEDGKSFVISNAVEFTRTVVPKYFKPTKFSSFTRKLYRWGFRQINRGLGPEDPVIFGCPHFQRDAPEEMVHMRSVTAAGARKDDSLEQTVVKAVPTTLTHLPTQLTGSKRTLEDAFFPDESLQQRFLLSKLLQQQSFMHQGHPTAANPLFSRFHPNSALALASMQYHHHHHHAPQYHHAEAPVKASSPGSYQQFLVRQPQSAGMVNESPTRNTADIVNAAIYALRNA